MTLLRWLRCLVSVPLLALAIAAVAPTAAHAQDPVVDLITGVVDEVREAAAPPSGCAGANLIPTRSNATALRKATLCLLNAERTKRGLRSLKERSRLRLAATRYSRAMVRANFFDHVSPGGQTMVQRILATGYVPRHRSWVLGENIGWGTGHLATPRGIVQAWMESPGHRGNVLGTKFREIGVGVVAGAPEAGVGDDGAAVYTTHYGAII